MESKNRRNMLTSMLSLGLTWISLAQLSPAVYHADNENVHHELKIKDGYLVHSVYEASPAKFIKTVGGFYTESEGKLQVRLEFNSDFEKDGLKQLNMAYTLKNGVLMLDVPESIRFIPAPTIAQDLDGLWLFATRGPDEGQERRGDENPRKTLKFLLNGHFQWIAYHVDTMKFSGTGGGQFTSKEGRYVETIDYFSRDDSRVGARLNFQYELKDSDWHHKGQTSKGEPMYEIWARRDAIPKPQRR